ncbi:MAG TPA: DUF222 domain-containing protein [Acidimicrobiia bacterium]|nr:DUF222 domain-containing protein [Acidimicrobiia bacterium]
MFESFESFGSFVEECVGVPDAVLDERLRANEFEQRRLTAERAALVAVAEHRGVFAAEHRSMAGYLRATVNCSDGAATRDRKLARLVRDYPEVGEALWAGHVSVEHAQQICRVQSNRRVREFLPIVVPVLVDLAEHSSHREFADEITNLIAKLDQDGAFADTADAVEGRRATVVEVGGTLVVSAHGGDPVQAAQLQAIFDAFADAEYRNDIAARRELHGDDAELHPLPRTHAQRSFDALVAIFSAASASPEGRALPEVVVNIVVDDQTIHDTLAHGDIVLPNGNTLDLDDTGELGEELLEGLAGELADDPDAFLARRCETPNGSPIHPTVVLRALLTGHVRRVVLDSRGVVIDYGTKQRLFTGLARQAAMLLARTCEFPGCTLPAAWSQVDHNHEWSAGGRTDQDNHNIGCGHHNRLKHRHRWRTRRDRHGRAYTLRDDGTIILPAGERPPDLSIDDYTQLARTRLRALQPTA